MGESIVTIAATCSRILPLELGGPGHLDRTGVELSESPAAHANDTNTGSG